MCLTLQGGSPEAVGGFRGREPVIGRGGAGLVPSTVSCRFSSLCFHLDRVPFLDLLANPHFHHHRIKAGVGQIRSNQESFLNFLAACDHGFQGSGAGSTRERLRRMAEVM